MNNNNCMENISGLFVNDYNQSHWAVFYEFDVEQLSSQRARLYWSTPPGVQVDFFVINVFDHTFNNGFSNTFSNDCFWMMVDTIPGHEYNFCISAFYTKYDMHMKYDVKRDERNIPYYRAVYTKQELFMLLTRAVDFAVKENQEHPMTEVHHLYRNKPTEYFANIRRNHRNMMFPYIKDNNGDAASPINGRLNGLFFSANTEGGQLPKASPFGNMRFTIPAFHIFTQFCRLYFADFYCFKTSPSCHYLTVVATREGSPGDRFCEANLLALDKFCNPFLHVNRNTSMVYVTDCVWVEVFLTEPIFLMEPGCNIQLNVKLIDRGTSTPTGLPKNTECQLCNIKFPIPKSFEGRKFARGRRRLKRPAGQGPTARGPVGSSQGYGFGPAAVTGEFQGIECNQNSQDGVFYPDENNNNNFCPGSGQMPMGPNTDQFCPGNDTGRINENYGPSKIWSGDSNDQYGLSSENGQFGPSHDQMGPTNAQFGPVNNNQMGPPNGQFGPTNIQSGPSDGQFGPILNVSGQMGGQCGQFGQPNGQFGPSNGQMNQFDGPCQNQSGQYDNSGNQHDPSHDHFGEQGNYDQSVPNHDQLGMNYDQSSMNNDQFVNVSQPNCSTNEQMYQNQYESVNVENYAPNNDYFQNDMNSGNNFSNANSNVQQMQGGRNNRSSNFQNSNPMKRRPFRQNVGPKNMKRKRTATFSPAQGKRMKTMKELKSKTPAKEVGKENASVSVKSGKDVKGNDTGPNSTKVKATGGRASSGKLVKNTAREGLPCLTEVAYSFKCKK